MTPSNRGSQPNRAARQPRQSSGKLPAHVYRRRRITLGVLSLVVVGLLVLGIVGIVKAIGGGSDGSDKVAAEETTPAETTTAAPVPDEKAASGKCPEDKVSLKAKVDPKSVKDGKEPEFGMVIENRTHRHVPHRGRHRESRNSSSKRTATSCGRRSTARQRKDENAEASTEFAPESEKTAKLKWNRIKVDKNCNRDRQ
jgi:hypothetical protein